MSEYIHSHHTSRELLSQTGDQFDIPRSSVDLDYTYEKDGERRSVQMDTEVIEASERMFVGDGKLLMEAARHIRTPLGGYDHAVFALERYITGGRTIGFSGYTGTGQPYRNEATAIDQVFTHLKRVGRRPELSVDGGGATGVLGLSAVVAALHEVPTLGIIPVKGLQSAGPRTMQLVYGHTYPSRQVLIGAIPDRLVVIGGAEGAQQEMEWALRLGSAALLVDVNDAYPKDSVVRTYRKSDIAKKGLEDGNLIVWRGLTGMSEAVDALMAVPIEESRQRRLQVLDALLLGDNHA